MTHFHYYATTTGKTDRILQYGAYPVALLLSHYVFGADSAKASKIAQVATAMCGAAMTSTFFGLESDIIDQDSYKAVAAEMGVDPDKIKFSDYKHSGNIIVRRAYEDLMRLQKWRYATDALFVLPAALSTAHKALYPGAKATRVARPDGIDMNDVIRDVGPGLAGKSAYWAYETFMVDKTSHYEVVKVRENVESTGKRVSADDLLGIYQRARDDSGLKRVELSDASEYNAIMPLLDRMAQEYNKHDGKFGLSEIVYLIGLGKVNIYGPDNKTISPEAIERSNKAIDKVLEIGLKGIGEENHKRNELGLPPEKSCFSDALPQKRKKGGFTDNFADAAFNTSQSALSKMFPKRPEEYVTRRDPSEVTTLASRNDGVNFTAGRA